MHVMVTIQPLGADPDPNDAASCTIGMDLDLTMRNDAPEVLPL